MRKKKNTINIKKLIFNVYNIPAIIITILNIIVLTTNNVSMVWSAILLMICFWISGILLYKKYNFSSIIAIISIIISFIISVRSTNNWGDPYMIHGLLFIFYIICELVIFYKKDFNKKVKRIVTVILILITAMSVSFSIVDYNLIKNEEMPKFMIKVHDSYESEYIGLGYAMTIENIIFEPYSAFFYNFVNFRSWFGLFQVYDNKLIDNETAALYLEIEPADNNEIKDLVSTEDVKIIGIGIENVIININEEEWYEIRDYFKIYTRSKFVSTLDVFNNGFEVFKDGGTTLYDMSEVKVLVCNTVEENYDIYIGDKFLEYKDDYCK